MDHQMSASIGATLRRIEADAQALSPTAIAQASVTGESPEAFPGFSALLREAVNSVNEKDRVAGEKMAAVDSGRSDDLVGAMLASQEASLSFSMLMQVRNKVVGALEDLIKLQI